jgi:hypothetical protein
MIRVLADAGATLDLRNLDGLTALDLAERLLRGPSNGADAPPSDDDTNIPDERARLEVVTFLREWKAAQAAIAERAGPAPRARGAS